MEDFETKQKIFNAILNATEPIRIIISIKGIRLKETFTFNIAPQQREEDLDKLWQDSMRVHLDLSLIHI